GAEDGVGAALGDRRREVAQLPRPARGDHRYRYRVGDRPGQLEVVAVVGPVTVHARQQHLPRASLDRLAGPGDRVAALDPLAPTLHVDAPGALLLALGVDRDHHALCAEVVGEL